MGYSRRRREPFRYEFIEPIMGTFRMYLNGVPADTTKLGSVQIFDLSPNGMKFSTNLDLPTNRKDMQIEISFILNHRTIMFLGELKWKKQKSSTTFLYGISGMEKNETKEIIIRELKDFSKKKKNSCEQKSKNQVASYAEF